MPYIYITENLHYRIKTNKKTAYQSSYLSNRYQMVQEKKTEHEKVHLNQDETKIQHMLPNPLTYSCIYCDEYLIKGRAKIEHVRLAYPLIDVSPRVVDSLTNP